MNGKLLSAFALVFAYAFAAQAPASTTSQCTLHVNPADRLHSIGEDFDAVHGLDQDLDHYYAVAGRRLDWLTTRRQIELLKGVPLGELSGLDSAQLELHTKPLNRAEALASGPRSAEGCVFEIYLPQIMLERGGLSSRSLRIFGVARRYDQGKLTHSYSGYAAAPMTGFQLRSPADASTATQLIETAYVEAVKTFLHNSTR